MNNTSAEQSDRRLEFLWALVSENVPIAGDIAEIAANTWAIHGVIPVDGHVIIAEFDTYEQAEIILRRIATTRLG